MAGRTLARVSQLSKTAATLFWKFQLLTPVKADWVHTLELLTCGRGPSS